MAMVCIEVDEVGKTLGLGYNTRVNHIKSSGLLKQRRYPFDTCVRGTDTMPDHTTRLFSETKIEYGYCRCGCGGKTSPARQTDIRLGYVRGEPVYFIRGHNSAKPRTSVDDVSLPPNTRAIPLTQGKYAIVDAADYEWLSRWRWYFVQGYVGRGENVDGRFLMHREILNAPNDMDVDHKDGNGLNNTRANLRLATQSQNLCNRVAESGYKGVGFQKRNGKWRARIKINRKEIYIGEFASAEDAARAYDVAALKHHGEFARLNFPPDTNGSYRGR